MNGVNLAKDPAAAYLAGVRAALADLPEPEVAEILDDVSAHLAELRGELGPDVDLDTRLGDPAAYAAELRAAAGYPEAPAPIAPGGLAAHAALVALVVATALGGLAGLWTFSGGVFGLYVFNGGVFGGTGMPFLLLVAAIVPLLAVPALGRSGPRVETVAALPVVRRLVASRPDPTAITGRLAGFAASLQPAWWLLRAFVAAMLIGLVLGRGGSFQALVVALTMAFAVVSVWLGYRSRADRRWLWLVVPLNAFAAALALTGFPGWASAAGYSPSLSDGYVEYPTYLPGLWQDGEREIRDIRPVDANGVPLTGVFLYDQDGFPVDAGGESCDDGGFPLQASDPLLAYPRGRTILDEQAGICVPVSATATPPSPVPSVPPGSPDGATGTAVLPPPPAEASPTDQAPPTR